MCEKGEDHPLALGPLNVNQTDTFTLTQITDQHWLPVLMFMIITNTYQFIWNFNK